MTNKNLLYKKINKIKFKNSNKKKRLDMGGGEGLVKLKTRQEKKFQNEAQRETD